MRGDVTKDCLGGFVERYVPLFITEIKHYAESNSDEMKNRLYQLDLAYSVEDVSTLTKTKPADKPPSNKKAEPDKF